jgi:hypothetical protein
MRMLFGVLLIASSSLLFLLLAMVLVGTATAEKPAPEGFFVLFGVLAILATWLMVVGIRRYRSAKTASVHPATTDTPLRDASDIPVDLSNEFLPVSLDRLRELLLTLNDQDRPFQVIDAGETQADLIAEWRLADAKWRAYFGKAGLKSTFRILIRFDESQRQVRCIDEKRQIAWSTGVPSLVGEWQRGQLFQWKMHKAWAIGESGKFEKVVDYTFSTAKIKDPIYEVIRSSGWKVKRVVFGKL